LNDDLDEDEEDTEVEPAASPAGNGQINCVA
jgi:hypothetical protein